MGNKKKKKKKTWSKFYFGGWSNSRPLTKRPYKYSIFIRRNISEYNYNSKATNKFEYGFGEGISPSGVYFLRGGCSG